MRHNFTSYLGSHLTRLVKISCLAVGLLSVSAPAYAQSISVIAVVEGDPITNFHLENRLHYLLTTTGIKMTAENEAQLRNDVLQMLIDDKIKLAEAEKVNPGLIPAARAKAIELVNDTYSSLDKSANQRLKELDLDRETVENKFLIDVIWASLLKEKFQNQFENAAKLAEQSLARLEKDLSQPQVKISEIVLAPTPSRPTAQNFDIANQMVAAIREGADFSAIARQYSAAGSASNGGRLDWIVTSTLPEAFQSILRQAPSGEVLDPVNIDGIIYILRKEGVRAKGLIDPSQTKLTLARALMPLDATISNADQLIAAGEMKKRTEQLTSCEAVEALNTEFASGQPSYLRDLELGSITPALRDIIEKLADNTPSEPLIFAEGMVVFMICEREMPKLDLPSFEEQERTELNKMFSTLSNRYLLRLRRSTNIELR